MSVLGEIIVAVLAILITAAISYSFWIQDDKPEKGEKYKTIGTCLATLMALVVLVDCVI